MLPRNNLCVQPEVGTGQLTDLASPGLQPLLDLIRAVGCSLPTATRHTSHTVCGASIALPVRHLLQNPPAFEEAAAVVREHAASDMGLTLTLSDLGDGAESIQAFEAFCSRLRHAGVSRNAGLGLCVTASILPLRAFALIAQFCFGAGPRYVLMDPLQMRNAATGTANSDTWQYLWRLRGTRWAVLPAYGDSVSTPCPLLADEAASAVLPAFGIQAPVGSAWLPVQLHLPRFANEHGVICHTALDRALTTCIDTGDQLLDLLCWPLANMQRDAWLNRRIAVVVTGFGDLVKLQKRDPSDLHVLQSLLDLAEHIRTTLWQRSTQIAGQTELLPSIARHEPSFEASDEHHQRSWAARWQIAVERSAVRHRNLLVMSPYSVLPADDIECATFTDLLPVIGCADAYNFVGPASFRRWEFKDFSRFHRRAWAVMQRRKGLSLIATRA